MRERVGEVLRRIAEPPLGGARQIEVVSPLAEGTDRLVAEEAIAVGAELICPLPLPIDEYERDFKSAKSIAAFRRLVAEARDVAVVGEAGSTPDDRNAAYVAAGRVMLVRADLLVAVWDGLPSRGEGGTAHIVAEAQDLGVPVVWIRADAPHVVGLLPAAANQPWQAQLDAVLG